MRTGYDAQLGFGKYGGDTAVPISQMTMGDLEDIGRRQIEASRGAKEFDLADGVGSSALGAYQFINPTRAAYAERLYGKNWRDVTYSPEVQDNLARALYNDTSNDNMNRVWSSWEKGRQKQGFDIDKDYILGRESGGLSKTYTRHETKLANNPPVVVEQDKVEVKPFGQPVQQIEYTTEPRGLSRAAMYELASQQPKETTTFTPAPRKDWMGDIMGYLSKVGNHG